MHYSLFMNKCISVKSSGGQRSWRNKSNHLKQIDGWLHTLLLPGVMLDARRELEPRVQRPHSHPAGPHVTVTHWGEKTAQGHWPEGISIPWGRFFFWVRLGHLRACPPVRALVLWGEWGPALPPTSELLNPNFRHPYPYTKPTSGPERRKWEKYGRQRIKPERLRSSLAQAQKGLVCRAQGGVVPHSLPAKGAAWGHGFRWVGHGYLPPNCSTLTSRRHQTPTATPSSRFGSTALQPVPFASAWERLQEAVWLI